MENQNGDKSAALAGADELNFAEFPLAVMSGLTSDQTSVTFEDEITDESTGCKVHRQLTVSSSDEHGLPTPRDSDVLLVLMWLTKHRNGFTNRTISFRPSELLKILGWDDSGTSYQRLRESMTTWAHVGVSYRDAWWEKTTKKWLSKTFHVLSQVTFSGERADDGTELDDGMSSFTWNEAVFASFQARNMKQLDLDTYFRLKRPTSRQAYRFLDKRFWHSSCLVFDFRTFCCNHIGFSKCYDNGLLKQKAAPMIGELESIGFLKPMPMEERVTRMSHGTWNILLVSQEKQLASGEARSGLVAALTKRGVNKRVAKTLLREFSGERIQQKLDLYDWLYARRDNRMSRSPAGFLVSAIRQDYCPEDFLSDKVRKVPSKRQAEAPAEARANARDAKLYSQFADHWTALTESMQAELRDLAIKAAPALIRSTFERLQRNQSSLVPQMQNEIIFRYWALKHSEEQVAPRS